MGDEFRTDGGAAWLNLLATQGQSFGAHPVERLPDARAVAAWLTLMGLPPAEPPTAADREALVAVRESLRSLAMAAVADEPFDPVAEAAVSLAAHGPGLSGAAGEAVPIGAAVSALCTQALVTLRSPDRVYLKQCAETDCRWVFLDPSGRRRWCPSPACASRGRVRAHRAGHASSLAASEEP